MSKGKKGGKSAAEQTPTQKAIEAIRKIPRDERSDAQKEQLSRLLDDEKRERFLRIGKKRVLQACKAIDGVARLGNKSTYKYSQEEADRIKGRLAEAMKSLNNAFGSNGEVSDEWKLFDE